MNFRHMPDLQSPLVYIFVCHPTLITVELTPLPILPHTGDKPYILHCEPVLEWKDHRSRNTQQ